MKQSECKLLVVGDAEAARRAAAVLSPEFPVIAAANAEQAAELLSCTPEIRVVLLGMKKMPPDEMFVRCTRERPDVTRVILCDAADGEPGLAAVREGKAVCFVPVPFRDQELLQAAHQALAMYRLRQERDVLLRRLDTGAVETLSESETRPKTLADMEKLKNDAVLVAAHDIRSPLSVILGYSDVLLDDGDTLDEGPRGMVERIRNCCGRLLGMVDHILDLSAIQSGAVPMQYRPVRLSELIQATVENLTGMIEEKKIALTVELSGDDQPYLLDEYKALRVLQNVLSNAVKFSGEKGSIALICRGEANRVSFSVSDTGSGLTAEQQARVFDRFSRFSTEKEKGCGLGLAIAKSLVERHGGTIAVESTPGEGSVFRFTLLPQQN